jgi:flagellar motility protein MotE (MotC chaperone)
MKIFLILILSLSAFGADKKFTQKEFDEKLKKEVLKRIDKLKKTSVSQLTKELVEKEEKLKDREADLTHKEEQVKMSETSLNTRILEFEGHQKKVLGCISSNKEKSAQRINQIVSIISGMKPVKAAQMLSIQDSQISVNILGRIDPKRASKIFNLMDKEVSARLQKQYLNMRK